MSRLQGYQFLIYKKVQNRCIDVVKTGVTYKCYDNSLVEEIPRY